MVAAGIYMLCRIEPLMVPGALAAIMWVGTVTALYAALCAIVQRDIKKVLAYSTLSQLGYMVAAFGLGSTGAAMFHLTTHAFFKALLFLGSGSVIYGCHHEQDIFKMGGLRKKMPLTFATFTIGVLAIIGLPGLAGFFSKDAILHLASEKNLAVFGLLALTAVLTAFYMVRMWKLVFLGDPRSEAASHAHEGGLTLTAPLVLLAALSVLGGYDFLYGGHFNGILSLVPHAEGSTILIVSLAVMIIGAGASLWLYQSAPTDSFAAKFPLAFVGLAALKESFDGLYNWYVAKVQQRFALLLSALDDLLIGGLVVRGLAGVTGLVGLGARALHVGSLHAYVWWFFVGAVVLWGYAAGWFH
jgi:NADH-quinone oxidoreductase subunit L